MAEMVKTEEILGQKWDKCVLDAGIKMSSGLAIGKLFLISFINFIKLILQYCFEGKSVKFSKKVELSENYYQIHTEK